MSKFAFASAILSLSAVAPMVWGGPVDTITLTPAGANTLFAIAGTFPADFATTPYSSPNTPYVLTFEVPTAPTSFAFADPIGVFVLDTSVTLNGVTYANSQAAFFNAALAARGEKPAGM